MASLHLVTGYKGTAHITALDQGLFNAGCVGKDEYVFSNGKRFEAEIRTNNIIRIYDGSLLMQGRHVNLESGGFVDVAIDSGSSSMNRNDLIAVRYQKDTSTGVESAEFVVIKGTAVSGTATDPSYYTGSILDGASIHDMLLYRVQLTGLTVSTVEPLFNVLAPLADIQYKQNMLINGDFRCNQRGSKTYDAPTTKAAYTVDMWRAFQVKVEVLTEGVKLTGNSASAQGYFTQFIRLDKLKTQNYTISAMVDGKIYTFTLTPGATAKEKNFGKFKISALTTSTWDNDYGDYVNKLKVNICPVGTSTFTLTYVDVFEGDVAYTHVKEDSATALMRCKQYIQKICYASPIMHYMMDGSNIQYQFAVCFDRMAHTTVSKPIVESCSWTYYDTTAANVTGNVTAETTTSLDGMFMMRTTSTKEKHAQCWGIRGVCLITCEPRDS